MPAPGEENYRYYNSNLQAPYMKCKTMTMDSFAVNHWDPSGICTYNGYKALSTSHTFTETDIECMGNSNMSGELTIYLRNNAGYGAVVLMVLTKGLDKFTYCDFYQALGNMTGVDVTVATDNLSFTVAVDPGVEARWVFRGF